jgi:predicted nucleic acid-binding protein
MAVIVDASAIAAIAFGEPDGATLAAHLEDETLLAPHLIDFELANTAAKKVRKAPEASGAVLAGLHAALTLPITRVPVPATEAFLLAVQTGLSAYDASYLWLARSRDAELVTLDRALVRLTSED